MFVSLMIDFPIINNRPVLLWANGSTNEVINV